MGILVDPNLKRGVTIVVVTHDDHVAGEAEKVLQLRQLTILGEKKGNLAKRKLEGPSATALDGAQSGDADDDEQSETED